MILSETTIFFGENNLSKTVILTEKRMVNLTSNYKFIVTNKNTVTSDSNFNLFFFGYGNWSAFTVRVLKLLFWLYPT